ncbi:glucose-1-phosphate cytidylyltransferase [Gammaproteobacteria bacterium]|nr:glucose-1-phosphate cytidylyltransferase [Gammaproteobacteria bacterium]MDC3312942.1 glucose-1-phosphate cytidylyltransferase [Gammaproteobacteria bacterium]
MKAVLLAGGLGTRISEETHLRPKPMIEIGGKPIIWHIMKMYSSHGVNEFVICCGYKGYLIKEYFSNYFLHQSDVTFDISKNDVEIHNHSSEPWKITLIDTGDHSMTGGRLKRVKEFIKDEEFFFFTYGDGLSDLDISKTINFHLKHKKLATITAVKPPGRYGALEIEDNSVKSFIEKPSGDGSYINGGFFVLSPKVIEFIDNDNSIWEQEPLQELAKKSELMAFYHDGFWQPMDTLREKNILDDLWVSGKAPWKKW